MAIFFLEKSSSGRRNRPKLFSIFTKIQFFHQKFRPRLIDWVDEKILKMYKNTCGDHKNQSMLEKKNFKRFTIRKPTNSVTGPPAWLMALFYCRKWCLQTWHVLQTTLKDSTTLRHTMSNTQVQWTWVFYNLQNISENTHEKSRKSHFWDPAMAETDWELRFDSSNKEQVPCLYTVQVLVTFWTLQNQFREK